MAVWVGWGVFVGGSCASTSSKDISSGSSAVIREVRSGLAGSATSVGAGSRGSCGSWSSSTAESSEDARVGESGLLVCLVFAMSSRKDGLDFSWGRGRRPSIYQQLGSGDV